MKTQMTRFILGMAFVAQSFSASAQGVQLTRLEHCDQHAGRGVILQNKLGETMGFKSLYINSNQVILNTKSGNQMILRCETFTEQGQRKVAITIINEDETATETNIEYKVEVGHSGTSNLQISQVVDNLARATLSKDANRITFNCGASGGLLNFSIASEDGSMRLSELTLARLQKGSSDQMRTSVLFMEPGKRVLPPRCMTAQEQETYFRNPMTREEIQAELDALRASLSKADSSQRILGVD